MAMEASMQLKCIIGLHTVGVRSSNGSIINVKPKTVQTENQLPKGMTQMNDAYVYTCFQVTQMTLLSDP